MSVSYAFVAQGRLFVARDQQDPQELSSQFAGQYEDRQARQQQAHGWKNHSGLWGEFGMGFPLGDVGPQGSPRRIRFSCAALGTVPGEVSYLVDFGHMTGLFQQTLGDRSERRLFHRNEFPARELSRDRQSGMLAMSVSQPDGSSRIAVCEPDGRLVREVTDGDTVDEAPSWTGDDRRRIVYQAAPILRNAAGFPMGLGPYAVEEVDLDAKKLSLVVEDDDHDCLQPREDAAGVLYYIRRPYRAPRARPSLLAVAKDVGLFPYRLLRAGFAYLDFFSMRYTGEPLRTAGGPERRIPVPEDLFRMWGHVVDPRKQYAPQGEAGSSLVPRDWQLVRRSGSGETETLARGVISFDLTPAGDIVYSTGTAVRLRTAAGADSELSRQRLVERVTVLDAAE